MNFNIKRLFLLDGIGALVTAFSIGVLIPLFWDWFQVPHEMLYLFAGLATCFAIYSLSCYFFLKQNRAPFLKVIMVANLLYCLLTLGYVWSDYSNITNLAMLYFFVEVLVVVTLVWFEKRVMDQEIK